MPDLVAAGNLSDLAGNLEQSAANGAGERHR